MRYSDLNDEQKKEFLELFYDLVDELAGVEGFDDIHPDNPIPWGCPWDFCDEEIDETLTIKELVTNFITTNADDIADAFSLQKCIDELLQDLGY